MIAQQLLPISKPNSLDLLPWLLAQGNDLEFDMAIAWLMLDPISFLYPDSEIEDEDDVLPQALYIARNYFVDLYADFGEWVWTLNARDLEKRVVNAINAIAPMPDTNFDDFGIALRYTMIEAVGINPFVSDWWEYSYRHAAALQPILSALNVTYDADAMRVTHDEHIVDTIAILVAALEKFEHPVYDNVAMLLQWLFVETGNTLFDFTPNDLYENGIPLPGWDEYMLACEAQDEANDMLAMAMQGIDILADEFDLFNALAANYCTVQRSLAAVYNEQPQRLDIHHDEFVSLSTWPEPHFEGTSGLTDSQMLYSRLRFWRDPGNPDHPLRR